MAESRKNGGERNSAASVYFPEAGADASTHDSGSGDGGKPIAKGDDVLKKGDVLGRYLVLEQLGAGAMGVVYAAYDPELDRKIAIKILRPQEGKGDRARRQERLVREAKAMAKLSHPNVGAIYDVGVHGDQVFLAMEFLSGGTLRDWIAAKKRPWREIVKMFIEVGKGLAGAHAEGLIHRDFKPDNVLLDKNGAPKVVDFGLVRLNSAALDRSTTGSMDAIAEEEAVALPLAQTALAANLTRTGALTGTPAYMAPEQFLGKAIDARTDQFAFCIALYEALYGERPFAGDTLISIAEAVTAERIRPLPKNSDIPTWIRRCLSQGLRSDPAQRYRGIDELLAALANDPAARGRRLVQIAVVAVAVALVVMIARHLEHRRVEFEQRIATRVAEGGTAFADARTLAGRLKTLRTQALALFDTRDREEGERVWAAARAESESFDASLDRAQRALAAALDMDSSRVETRKRLAEVLFERAELAEREFRREDVARHVAVLDAVDTSGEQRRRWQQPGVLSLVTDPPGARVNLERFETTGGDRITTVVIASNLSSPIADRSLDPGSYRLKIEMSGRAATSYPFVIKRGEKLTASIPLLPANELPPDFRYVPAGRFLYGEKDEDWRLSFLNAVPLHERAVPAFLIKTHETTFGEWIEFLETLPPKERASRLPSSEAGQGTVAVALSEIPGGRWKLQLDISKRPVEATSGQPLLYPGRPTDTAKQDWLKMPVLGVSARDVRAYLAWLSATGKVPGARLCREVEWERAARGADDRAYPTSRLRLVVQDANVDATYGRVSGAYGPDEVGRHPRSRSPFDVEDLSGNAWEIVESDDVLGGVLERGGGYYHQPHNARLTNREPIEVETRNPHLGFRVCADRSRQLKPKER